MDIPRIFTISESELLGDNYPVRIATITLACL